MQQNIIDKRQKSDQIEEDIAAMLSRIEYIKSVPKLQKKMSYKPTLLKMLHDANAETEAAKKACSKA